MEKFVLRASNWVFWLSFILSGINVFAGIFGTPAALNWLFGTRIPAILLLPLGVMLWASLLYYWIEAGLRNACGNLILLANVLAGPFFYAGLGIPHEIGLLIALFPFLFYFGSTLLIEFVESRMGR